MARTALITEASSEVGKAVALKLLSEGIKVYAATARVEELLPCRDRRSLAA